MQKPFRGKKIGSKILKIKKYSETEMEEERKMQFK